ncbi:hypothetical protein LTR91_007255 [Friedmanniomyces endolithicus]|uniref:Uncharacterized protein n=1 Tax=Friedmanniomyces endolithicus TaxID=329885 RepID=A0AAN6KQQ1_9PEZI|nr:hypothetical protein LTR38_015027 [Friedmanniomyces endolithicus]KAK0780499.1 hypothetical protein LTR75_015004 [Friedmanniomyces endolithicus]KAK0805643.1 hypothetical protein LTR59_003864 [Friedmanniomyces endolithicus]KAK0833250.1 hypothetical protein LTR03_014951 [Friedmanniomyces endolithicus]KAK0844354.1 hypothetical protein LTS02_015723 [Friedmanniomyces endolithicus]
MPPKADEAQSLQFVVTTNPGEATTAANKKRVRSQAALQSWPERRKRNFEQLEGFGTGFRVATPTPPARPKERKARSKKRQPLAESSLGTLVAHEHARPLPTPAISTSSNDTLTVRSSSEEAEFPCSREKTPDFPCRCWQCHPERRLAAQQSERRTLVPHSGTTGTGGELGWQGDLALISPPSSPEPSRPFTGLADPYNCYPVPYKPWFDGILHHMLTVFAPRGWPALNITRDQGLAWERYMVQHSLAEPALFYVRLLFASGDLVNKGVLQPEISLWLRAAAIKTINEALRDPKRASSDPLILAVGRIALHESLYGDRDAANSMHRPAQQRMIQMRGGMNALDFPKLVKRLMRWSDTVMSKQAGTQRFLEDDEKVQNFTMRQSVQVLEKWVPEQGEDLRKKMRISEILND